MRLPTLLLYKKEFQQNSILYLLPAPFAFALIYLRLLGVSYPEWMGSVIGLAIPFTLAIAYGLQAFDIEEDAQTRDFLLVKPLSLWRIVCEKFLIGLCFLVCWVMIAVWGALKNLSWPSIYNVNSWVPCLIVLGSIIIYGASFFTGLWISGPKKLLFASIASLLGIAWGFLTFSSLMTFIMNSQIISQMKLIQESLFYLSGLSLVGFFIFLHLHLSIWFLLQRPQINEYPRLGQAIGISLVLPIIAIVLNFSVQPPLRSSYLYGFELLGAENPFWTIDGAWQPHGNYMALIGNHNQIGLARLGEKPHVIYRFRNIKENSIKDLSWSPDGKGLTFVVQDQVYFMNIRDKKPIWLGQGYSPIWSRQSDSVLFAREDAKPQIQKTPQGNLKVYNIGFYSSSTKEFLVQPTFNIRAISHFMAWDSPSDSLLSLDPYGRLIIYGRENVNLLPLPGFQAHEGIFWGRFFPVPDESGNMILIVYSVKLPLQKDFLENHTVQVFKININRKKIFKVGVIPKSGYSSAILNPKSGVILWGKGSTYVKGNVFSAKEVKP